MKLNKEDRREEMAAYSTMALMGIISVILIGVLIQTIFNLF